MAKTPTPPHIVTVTLNSALDRLLFIDQFQPGQTMRPHKMVDCVGGKGFATSVVLKTLAAPNVAVGLVAGITGQQLVRLLDGYGIEHDLVWVGGETRISHVVIEALHHRHSHLISGSLSVSSAGYQTLLHKVKQHAQQAQWVVAAGTIADGVPGAAYSQLIALAQVEGAAILVDSSGPPVLEMLATPPHILKMNWAEFDQTFKLRNSSLEALVAQAKAVQKSYALPALVITCGQTGILALLPDIAYLVSAPVQQANNAAGAGDGVSAALVWRLALGDSWIEALRWAAATGASIVLTEGTADCHLTDIERILPEVIIETVQVP